MDNTKIKSLSLTKLKVSEVDHEGRSERRVTFVASTSSEDRDHEKVNIKTFRLPLKGGGYITVANLPSGGIDTVDIPLLTDHNMWEVEKTIGSVRNARFEDEKLIFEAGISSRPYAQDVFKLVEEGHLDNAFSIRFGDYDYNFDTDTNSNGEILEVSLVTRGANKDAQVLEVKSMKGEKTMPEEGKVTEEKQKAADVSESAPKAEKEKQNIPVESAEEKEEEKEKSMDGDTNHKQIAASQVKMPSQTETSAKFSNNKSDYLKSKQAEADYARHIVDNYNRPGSQVAKAWKDKMRAKGITGDDILPTRFENIFFKGWEDHYEALGTFRRTNLLAGHVYAWNTTDRALGHKKGDKKADQNIVDVRRDYKFKVMYKKLPIDLQDLLDDDTGELLRMRSDDLSGRMGDEAVRATVFGDGRTQPTTEGAPDYRIFDGTRGPWSMVNDLNNAGTTGSFSAAVATVIANSTSDSLYAKLVKTIAAVKGGAGRKIVFVPEGTATELLLSTDSDGRLMFAPGTNVQELLGAYIFESPYMTGSGYDVIAYREGQYLLALGEMMTRTTFDLDYNTDVMMLERAISGTMYGHKTLAGYASKA